MERAQELGWDANDPTTWTCETTVDAHLGYHHTGNVMREYQTITDDATDYEPDLSDMVERDGVETHLLWWADVLPAIHAAKVALAEASPEELATATETLHADFDHEEDDIGAYLFAADDLEIAASRARRIIRALP